VTQALFTICAPNYLPRMRVLMDSVRATNPDIELYALVIGVDCAGSRDAVLQDVELFSEIDVLNNEELTDMPFIYDLLEFATALKPFAFRWLMAKEKYKELIYLDPDIEVYQSLGAVFVALEQHPIVLTPHTLEPMPEDGLLPNSADISLAGIYNLGFIGVRNEATAFIDWWCDRLRFDCVSDLARGLFVDQKWIDWAPALFDVGILKDPSLNVAYWNIHERNIGVLEAADSKSVVAVNGNPLTFFHFSGFDPDRPEVLSKHSRLKARVIPSENETLMSLCRSYASRTRHFARDSEFLNDYAYSEIAPGVTASKPIRRALRDARTGGYLKISDRERSFSGSTAFVSWLKTPQGRWSLTPLEVGFWMSREDLRLRQENLDTFSARRLSEWSKTSPEYVAELNSLGVDAAPGDHVVSAPQPPAHNSLAGVSVLAYANAEMGVGEGGRRLFGAIRQTGIPSELVGLRAHLSRDQHGLVSKVSDSPNFQTVVSCVNADQVPIVSNQFSLNRHTNRHIGYWAWELEEFPSEFMSGIDAVNEIWTMSTFIQKAVEAKTDKKVSTVPVAFKAPSAPTSFTRAMLGLPNDKFVFLTSFDYLSVPRRKNPQSTMEAYISAFGESDGACLIVKSINSNKDLSYQASLRTLASSRKDVIFIDDYLSDIETLALIELADCLVSLHRSEGFGLNMADAMALGTPVVATNYGGNLDFMSDRSAALVDYELHEVGEGNWPYNPKSLWAEPSLSHAADQMTKVFNQASYRENLVRESRKITSQFSTAQVSARVLMLLNGEQ
jgi:glycosyltransferase involved in cell wall biosynthesis